MRQPTPIPPLSERTVGVAHVLTVEQVLLPDTVAKARRALAESDELLRWMPDGPTAEILGRLQASVSELIRTVTPQVVA